MALPLIRFENASKSFARAGQPPAPAVEPVRLDVRAGEFVTLVGPSGCGKSTLLNMAAGLFAPTTGAVHYAGAPVTGVNRRVGYMTQSDHLLPWRDIAGNVAIPLEIRGWSRRAVRARVADLLALVGLTDCASSYPSQVSGGMRKRTGLARLLACEAETLLMDEPFGALDAQLRLGLQIELKRLATSLGKTVLFVTHDLDEAIALADRCVVFAGRPGRIVRVFDVSLPRDRDLRRLRFDPAYTAACAELWEIMLPDIG